jgi:hemerythrin-like domain-containing protein
MLRNKNLIPLSREHQHALALCVRIGRALQRDLVDLDAWQLEVEQQYQQEIGVHFAAEERVLFPAARRFPELVALVEELSDEHVRLRECFARAHERVMDRGELGAFAELLSGHIRKEERQLFEALQKLVEADEMRRIGAALERELAVGHRACILPKPSRD